MTAFVKMGCMVLLLSLSFVISVNQPRITEAQSGLTLIYSDVSLTNFFWSPESDRLIFQKKEFDAGVMLDYNNYFDYDTTTQALTQTNMWPLQPLLTEQERQAYNPYRTLSRNEDDYMFQSPNQRYVLYIAAPGRVLALADRQTVQSKQFDILAGNTLETQFFFAVWSENNQSLVVGNNPILGDFPRYYFISNFTFNIQDATIQEICLEVTLDGHDYGGGYVEDISANGFTLLMSPLDLAPRVRGARGLVYLAAYDPTEPSTLGLYENALVRDQNIIASAFDPYDERYLIALTQEGIQRYNTLTNVWTTLNAEINSTSVDYALFSPDGMHIVLEDVTDPNFSQSDVYVIDLAQIVLPLDEP